MLIYILIKKEFEKIRHTFKYYVEPGERMYPDWDRGDEYIL